MRMVELRAIGVVVVAAGANAAGQTAAEPEERAVSFEIGTGIEYDSNVALLELDTTTDAGDAIALVDFSAAYDMKTAGRLDFNTGYNFSETIHEDFDDFDLRIHRGSATLSYDLGRVDTGAIVQYARAELDGANFMTLEQFSPYVSTLAGERIFLRFAYTRSDKDFASNPLRAATTDSWSSDFYYFVNGLRTYVLAGFRHDHEDAVDPQFDYGGDKLRIQLSHRFPVGAERALTFKVGARSERRDYDGITQTLGVPRRDDRLQFEASGELPLTDRVTTRFGYKRANNESNLAAVDFDEDVYSLTFTATF